MQKLEASFQVGICHARVIRRQVSNDGDSPSSFLVATVERELSIAGHLHKSPEFPIDDLANAIAAMQLAFHYIANTQHQTSGR